MLASAETKAFFAFAWQLLNLSTAAVYFPYQEVEAFSLLIADLSHRDQRCSTPTLRSTLGEPLPAFWLANTRHAAVVTIE